MLTQPKNLIITDVELNWARLDTPADNPFGGEKAWELQIATTDAAKADSDHYPVRWVKYMNGRPHKPIGNAKVFTSNDQVYNFQTIVGRLRSALWV